MIKYKRLFLDTNVVFDLFDKKTEKINRYNSTVIFQQIFEKKYVGYISPVTFLITNYFIIKQNISEKAALKKIQFLDTLVKTTSLDQIIVKKAMYSHFHDFEDALQYYSAEAEPVDVIITRDAYYYYKIKLPVLSPSEFLQNIDSNKL